jgi:hypothetical protein
MLSDLTIAQLSGQRKLREWLNLEQVAAMIDGGGADTGGVNKYAHGTHLWTPGTATTPADLKFQPAVRKVGPWDNLYEYNTLSRDYTDIQFFSNEFEIMYPTQALIDADVAVENELELCEAGLAFDMAWQYKPSHVDGLPAWRWFNETAPAGKPKWTTVQGLPTPAPKPGVWIPVVAYFSINRANKSTTHEAIVIDRVFYAVGQVHQAQLKWSPLTWYIHNALQLDSNGKGTPEGIQIRNWNVRGL